MLPAYQNLVATHPSIRSRASQELGLGASAGKAVAGQSESSVLGSRQGQGRSCAGGPGRGHPVKACLDRFADFLRGWKSCVGCQHTPPG